EFVDIELGEVHHIVTFEPALQLRGNLQAGDEFVASGKFVLLVDFGGDIGITLGEDVKGELADGFRASAGRGDALEEVEGAGGVLRVARERKQEQGRGKRQKTQLESHGNIVAD